MNHQYRLLALGWFYFLSHFEDYLPANIVSSTEKTKCVRFKQLMKYLFIYYNMNKFNDQKRINIYYEGQKVGTYIPDKIVNYDIIIELKSKPFVTQGDVKQSWPYLKGTSYKLGFLINFGNKLEIKRVVYDTARSA